MDTNTSLALEELYLTYNLNRYINSFNEFFSTFTIHNNRLWAEYGKGNVSKEELRRLRFYLTLKEYKLKDYDLASILDKEYLRICPTKTALFPDTHELLQALKDARFPLYIITNGFTEIQEIKMTSSNILHYFEKVYDSDTVGFQKPSSKMFNKVLNDIQAKAHECLMVGDDWEADIEGAAKVGIDQVYFNPKKKTSPGKATYEIHSLLEILPLVSK